MGHSLLGAMWCTWDCSVGGTRGYITIDLCGCILYIIGCSTHIMYVPRTSWMSHVHFQDKWIFFNASILVLMSHVHHWVSHVHHVCPTYSLDVPRTF